SLMCGLTKEVINAMGGINLTKYQAYKSLCSSASVEWEEFAKELIDKCIVVDDLTVTINTKVDYINRDTYDITPNVLKDVEIEVTDGCGIMLPSVSDKSFMIRAPHIKGLLVPFDFQKFQKEHPNASATVTDIYNNTHDIIKDEISIILTRSQFKMADYYDNWAEYQNNFKKYNCQAAKLNEEDTSGEATLTYQMLQTLTDISDDELQEIASSTTNDIRNLGRDRETTLRIMGASDDNERKNYFQQALSLYPNLLNDKHTKEAIKKKKEALIKDSKSGKIRIDGAKYTFLIPDLYALCQKIFGLEVTGLLESDQVYCRLYDEGEMCILRSPHLHKEWGIRNNTKSEKMKEWFITDGIFTSINDNLSKMLQFDHDGDKSLCIQSDLVTKIAKRNMWGIIPLYYEMAKANAEQIDDKNLYNSLVEAYKAQVGVVSNEITKIWNRGRIDDNAKKVVKWLTMESNFQIDRAKTNFMTERPDHIDKIIKSYTKTKTPYFFQWAKNKEASKVEGFNLSTVNRLVSIIDKANKRMYFAKVADKFDYKQLLKNKRIKLDDVTVQEIIAKYEDFSENIKLMMNESVKDDIESGEVLPVHKFIRKEFLKIKNNAHYVSDVLVKYLYSDKDSPFKTILWSSFGKEIIRNIKKNVHNIVECKSCGCTIDEPKKNQMRCIKCQKLRDNEKSKFGMQKLRLMTIA
ncbi:hypothetical protein, partial [Bacillus sp. JJ1474]|uniref:hypothetical protein n=1 Tax=Bacillus sp. JJ1474 TaxID=3122955 RepID=UPI002FFF77E6